MTAVALIGGTGLETLPPEYSVQREVLETPFGNAVISRLLWSIAADHRQWNPLLLSCLGTLRPL